MIHGGYRLTAQAFGALRRQLIVLINQDRQQLFFAARAIYNVIQDLKSGDHYAHIADLDIPSAYRVVAISLITREDAFLDHHFVYSNPQDPSEIVGLVGMDKTKVRAPNQGRMMRVNLRTFHFTPPMLMEPNGKIFHLSFTFNPSDRIVIVRGDEPSERLRESRYFNFLMELLESTAWGAGYGGLIYRDHLDHKSGMFELGSGRKVFFKHPLPLPNKKFWI